jgi:hypothetical protein
MALRDISLQAANIRRRGDISAADDARFHRAVAFLVEIYRDPNAESLTLLLAELQDAYRVNPESTLSLAGMTRTGLRRIVEERILT